MKRKKTKRENFETFIHEKKIEHIMHNFEETEYDFLIKNRIMILWSYNEMEEVLKEDFRTWEFG